jgi:hypothetical protein
MPRPVRGHAKIFCMSILSLYSRRKRQRQNSGKADVYRYDELPMPLRVQILDLWRWATGHVATDHGFGLHRNEQSWDLWEAIYDALRHEKGAPLLAAGDDQFARCANYFLSPTVEMDDLLDVLELTFRCIGTQGALDEWVRRERGISVTATQARPGSHQRPRERKNPSDS